jgi:hypothetical protein
MGRPPIGKRAMTGAERVQRHRAKQQRTPVTKRNETAVAKPTAPEKELAQMGWLRAEVARLKAMLREDADAAKYRKKVVELQAQMAEMRRVMKEIAKERDRYQKRVRPKFREATGLLTSQTYRAIVKALHSDRVQHVTPAELKAAERVFITLRPLFIDD